MRHFIAYHNEQKMRYSCTEIPVPRVKTSKSVSGLDGVTVWLIAGEGKSPKSYYLAAKFTATKCEPNLYPGTDLPNQISGEGTLFKKGILLNGSTLLKLLQNKSANFVNGFYESRDPTAIAYLEALTK